MRSISLSLAIVVSCTGIVSASLRTDDAHFDDKYGFPSLEAILAGRFERHSTFYFDQTIRIQNARRVPSYVPGKPVWMANFNLLSAAHCIRGNFEQAIAVIEQSPALMDRLSTHEATLGTAYLAQGDFQRAIQHLRKSMHLSRTRRPTLMRS